MRRSEAGFSAVELLVAATVGLALTGAALTLLSTGNRLVAASLLEREAWRHAVAAAGLWASEWRGAGYDPTGAAGAGVVRLAADTMEFTADWNGNGALEPTDGNPNERLAWAGAPGAWKRGVNGGPRLPVAWPDSTAFAFRDSTGRELGGSPAIDAARLAEARFRVSGIGGGAPLVVAWGAARRNP